MADLFGTDCKSLCFAIYMLLLSGKVMYIHTFPSLKLRIRPVGEIPEICVHSDYSMGLYFGFCSWFFDGKSRFELTIIWKVIKSKIMRISDV